MQARGIGGSVVCGLVVMALTAGASTWGQGAIAGPSARHWSTGAGGLVRALAAEGEELFLGGAFSSLESSLSTHGVFDLQAAAAHPTMHGIITGGSLWSVEPDGRGGWYVGGRFPIDGGTATRQVIHILPNGELDRGFDVAVSDTTIFGGSALAVVRDVELAGNTLYISGQFSAVNGLPRVNVAALDATTGAVLPFDAGFVLPVVGAVTDSVWRLAADGGTVYLLGQFQMVQGQARYAVAAVDAVTGALRPFSASPGTVGIPNDMVASGGVVYLVGSFQSLQGVPQNRIAALDGITGMPLPGFTASADNTVTAVHVTNSRLYVAGGFSMINNLNQNNLAALDPATGALLPWTPPPFTMQANTFPIGTINSAPGRVIVGGTFTTVGGVSQSAVAVLDETTAQLVAWDPDLQAAGSPPPVVGEVAVQGNLVHLSGRFSLAAQGRDDVAAIGLRDGQPRPFAPTVNGSVEAVVVRGDQVFLGGIFSNVGGQFRLGLAEVTRATGAVTSWTGGANSSVTAMVGFGQTLYCAGNFTMLGGQARAGVGAVDMTTGLATPFDPGFNGTVNVMRIEDDILYVGGDFTQVGANARSRLAAFDLATGALLPWGPSVDDEVTALAVDGGDVFLGGSFANVGGQPRSRLAAVDVAAGQVQPWDPGVSGGGPVTIEAIEAEGPRVWIGGLFGAIGGQTRQNLAEIDRATGLATSWNPGPNAIVSTMRRFGRRLAIGGSFSSLTSFQSRMGLAVYDLRDLATVGLVAPACSNTVLGPRLRSTRPVMPGGHEYLVDRAPSFASGALYVSFEPIPGAPPILLPGGCSSGLQPESLSLLTLFTTDVNGEFRQPIPLPLIPALQNLPIRAGAVVTAPGGAINGTLDLTETLELVVGS